MTERLLLTIAIPTYNRAKSLRLLLSTLRSQVAEHGDRVCILVSDNASTDATPSVMAEMKVGWPQLVLHRNGQNIGAEANFCECLDRISSRYFWIMGDDDLPKAGVIVKVLHLLETRQPALLYLQSEWVDPLTGPDQGVPVSELHVDWLGQQEFARRVHVWITFISGMVVDRRQLTAGLEGSSYRRFLGTSLVQLGWVLPTLRAGSSFAFVHDRCVLATRGNTGGYALLTVFGVNFARICRQALGNDSPMAARMVDRAVRQYLPGLVWSSRGKSSTRFAKENPWPAMRQELGGRWTFWAVIYPLGHLPRGLALVLLGFWRIIVRLEKDWYRLSRSRRLAGRNAP